MAMNENASGPQVTFIFPFTNKVFWVPFSTHGQMAQQNLDACKDLGWREPSEDFVVLCNRWPRLQPNFL